MMALVVSLFSCGQPPNPEPCQLIGQLATDNKDWAGRGVGTGKVGAFDSLAY